MNKTDERGAEIYGKLATILQDYLYTSYNPQAHALMKDKIDRVLNYYSKIGRPLLQPNHKGQIEEVVDFRIDMDEQSGTVELTPLFHKE